MPNPQISQAAARALNLPDGFKTYSPFPFGGINLQASGIAIGDQEFIYAENFFKLGEGYLRTAWDVGPSIFGLPEAGRTIVSFFFYNIGAKYYCAVFLSDGSAIQLDLQTNPVNQLSISAPGVNSRFYDPATGQLPACSQWGAQYLLISNNNTRNDYWIWDGAHLYTSGTVAPNGVVLTSTGSGYQTSPTVTIQDGHGGSFAGHANVIGGQVVGVTIDNPGNGFRLSDTPQLIFSGGGIAGDPHDNGAYLTAILQKTTVGSIDVVAPGSGYWSAPSVTIGGGGGGSGATAHATVNAAGQVTAITVDNQGSGYTSAPSVVIGGPGTGAQATAFLDASGVASVQVTNTGQGYQYPPPLTITGGGGSGAVASAILFGTSVASIQMTSGGTGYTSTPTVTFVGGGGTGATVGAVHINNGVITAIDLASYPTGSGYTGQPFLQISGGGGSGATALVMLTPTAIKNVVVGATGQGYTSRPSVIIGGGSNQAASATLNMMPFGVSGASIETFQQRVFLANQAPAQFDPVTHPTGGNFVFSAAGTVHDFALSDGGGFQTNSDSFLQTRYEGIRQSNGYLYFFGDGSVSVVSNITTSGTPASTTFTYLNADLQVGLSWRDSRQDFGRSMLIGNETGIYGLYGGSVTKVSDKLNKLFDAAVFPITPNAQEPSAAIAHIHEVKHYFLLMTIIDPDTGDPRKVMATWNEKDWVVTSQTVNLIYIGPQKKESEFTAWGTDGAEIFPLFQVPSSQLVKRLDTKLYGTDSQFLIKDFHGLYVTAQDYDGNGINMSVVLSASGIAQQNPNFGSVPSGTYSGPQILYENPAWLAGEAVPPFWSVWGAGTGGVPFMTLGARISSTSPDFAIGNFAMGYTVTTALK